MKIKVLPFTCIKLHFEGEIFAPVDIGGEWELQSANSVLCGSSGNVYRFTTASNASVWIDSNLIRASKQQITRQLVIDKLIVKNSQSPQSYLQTEIAVLQARNAGEWGVYFNSELVGDWGIIAKGDKGDKGDAGVGGFEVQSVQIVSWANTTPWLVATPHFFGRVPDLITLRGRIKSAVNGYAVGDMFDATFNGGVSADANMLYLRASIGTSVTIPKRDVSGFVSIFAINYDFVATAYRFKP